MYRFDEFGNYEIDRKFLRKLNEEDKKEVETILNRLNQYKKETDYYGEKTNSNGNFGLTFFPMYMFIMFYVYSKISPIQGTILFIFGLLIFSWFYIKSYFDAQNYEEHYNKKTKILKEFENKLEELKVKYAY